MGARICLYSLPPVWRAGQDSSCWVTAVAHLTAFSSLLSRALGLGRAHWQVLFLCSSLLPALAAAEVVCVLVGKSWLSSDLTDACGLSMGCGSQSYSRPGDLGYRMGSGLLMVCHCLHMTLPWDHSSHSVVFKCFTCATSATGLDVNPSSSQDLLGAWVIHWTARRLLCLSIKREY